LIYLKHECELEDIDIINFGREAIEKSILTNSEVGRRWRLTDWWVIKTSLADRSRESEGRKAEERSPLQD
jgi:hypothetical protein